MTDRSPDILLEFRSDPQCLCGVRELVLSIAKRYGLSDESASRMTLAVDEAVCNIIRHGYQSAPDGPIWLRMWGLADQGAGPGIRIVIEDEARQIEPGQIKGRDLDDIRPGGLGVHIIREVTDEAVYEKRAGGGMRLTLVKRETGRSGPAPAARAGGCGG
ncbi:MAG: ATP-binding protein [Phycisphaerales bacterium JB039]